MEWKTQNEEVPLDKTVQSPQVQRRWGIGNYSGEGDESSTSWQMAIEVRGWIRSLFAKYDISRNRWQVRDPRPRFSSIWKGILASKEMFSKNIRYCVGKGDKVFFWRDPWVGEAPLAISFPNLFNCATNQIAKVIDYLERIDDRVVWGPIFRRNLNEVEEAQFTEMMKLIRNVFIPKNGADRRVWTASTNGMFSVAFYSYP